MIQIFDKGYIKLYRSLLNWEWYGDINTKILFIHFLLTINYEDKNWKGIYIKRGQRVATLKTLEKETGLTRQNLRTSLKNLKSTQELTQEKVFQTCLYTITNFEKYQEPTQNQQLINTKLTQSQHENNTYIRNKEVKNIKDIYSPAKPNHTELISNIVDYLNQKTGTRYQSKAQSTQKKIKARLNEGYTLDDFINVIDKKSNEWRNTDMAKFLRPETLFGTKFEGYLNQPIQLDKPKVFNKNRFKNFEGRDWDFEKLEEMEKEYLKNQINGGSK